MKTFQYECDTCHREARQGGACPVISCQGTSRLVIPCPNCGQWVRPEKSGMVRLTFDCFHDCTKRGFAQTYACPFCSTGRTETDGRACLQCVADKTACEACRQELTHDSALCLACAIETNERNEHNGNEK